MKRDFVANTLRMLHELGVHRVLEVVSVEEPAVITVAHSIIASPLSLGQVADEIKKLEGVSGVVATPRRS